MSRGATADEILSQLELFGVRLGLESTRRLLAALGRPERHFESVLVAGTNGKGSTSALLAAMCSAAGYRTGLFTSPHLEAVTERAQIDGLAIAQDELAELLAEVVEASGVALEAPPTYFEALFVAFCLWLARREADIAVLEVGMGGRLDATNAVEPVVSVVTRVGLEHQIYLGDELEAIAGEKAGIFRRSRPAVIGDPGDAGSRALLRLAVAAGAVPVYALEAARVVDHHEHADWSQRVAIESRRGRYEIEMSLCGDFQRDNLLTALVAAEEMAVAGWSLLTTAAIERGAALCRWPGRLERFALADGAEVILDSAHNPQAAEALAAFLAPRSEPLTLLFAVLEDKNAGAMLHALQRVAGAVILTTVGGRRGRNPLELMRFVDKPATVTTGVSAALDLALSRGRPILVTGSIYLVGEVRMLLRARFGPPESTSAHA